MLEYTKNMANGTKTDKAPPANATHIDKAKVHQNMKKTKNPFSQGTEKLKKKWATIGRNQDAEQ